MKQNVSNTERVASLAAGALGLWWSKRAAGRSMGLAGLGMAAAAGLLARGATGRCGVYAKLGVDTAASRRRAREPQVRSVRVGKPLAEVAAFLRDRLGDRFARDTDPNVFHGRDDLASWTVRLTEASSGSGTRIALTAAPGGSARARWTALAHAATPLVDAAETELRNLKALIETGEIATTLGQAHGGRSTIGQAVLERADLAREHADAVGAQARLEPRPSWTPPATTPAYGGIPQ
jgi:hypothetical protein